MMVGQGHAVPKQKAQTIAMQSTMQVLNRALCEPFTFLTHAPNRKLPRFQSHCKWNLLTCPAHVSISKHVHGNSQIMQASGLPARHSQLDYIQLYYSKIHVWSTQYCNMHRHVKLTCFIEHLQSELNT